MPKKCWHIGNICYSFAMQSLGPTTEVPEKPQKSRGKPSSSEKEESEIESFKSFIQTLGFSHNAEYADGYIDIKGKKQYASVERILDRGYYYHQIRPKGKKPKLCRYNTLSDSALRKLLFPEVIAVEKLPDSILDNPKVSYEDKLYLAKSFTLRAAQLTAGYSVIDIDNHKKVNDATRKACESFAEAILHVLEAHEIPVLHIERSTENGGFHIFCLKDQLWVRKIIQEERQSLLAELNEELIEGKGDLGGDHIRVDYIGKLGKIRFPFSYSYEPIEWSEGKLVAPVDSRLSYWRRYTDRNLQLIEEDNLKRLAPASIDIEPQESLVNVSFSRDASGLFKPCDFSYGAGERVSTLKTLAFYGVHHEWSFDTFKIEARKADRGSRDYAEWDEARILKDLQSFWATARKAYSKPDRGAIVRRDRFKAFNSNRHLIRSKAKSEVNNLVSRLLRTDDMKELQGRMERNEFRKLIRLLIVEIIGQRIYNRARPVQSTISGDSPELKEYWKKVVESEHLTVTIGEKWLRLFAEHYGFGICRARNVFAVLKQQEGFLRNEAYVLNDSGKSHEYLNFEGVRLARRYSIDNNNTIWNYSIPTVDNHEDFYGFVRNLSGKGGQILYYVYNSIKRPLSLKVYINTVRDIQGHSCHHWASRLSLEQV